MYWAILAAIGVGLIILLVDNWDKVVAILASIFIVCVLAGTGYVVRNKSLQYHPKLLERRWYRLVIKAFFIILDIIFTWPLFIILLFVSVLFSVGVGAILASPLLMMLYEFGSHNMLLYIIVPASCILFIAGTAIGFILSIRFLKREFDKNQDSLLVPLLFRRKIRSFAIKIYNKSTVWGKFVQARLHKLGEKITKFLDNN